MTAEIQELASGFKPASHDVWRKLAEATLNGGSFDSRLVSHSRDGIRIEPLYTGPVETPPLAARAAARPWDVVQRIDNPDPAAAARQALDDLENGAGTLEIVTAEATNAYGFGVAGLIDVPLGGVGLRLSAGRRGNEVARRLADHISHSGTQPQECRIDFGLNPIGALAAGGLDDSVEAARADFIETVAELRGQGFEGPYACADGRIVHAAGGSQAQELAFALAIAVAYLRAVVESGDEDPAQAISLALAADADQFATTAKFRAMRRLWARVLEASGLAPVAAKVHGETAWRMMTRRDPHTNMLRAGIACFAAAVGGADSVSVLPFTQAAGLPNGFARRVARNTGLILADESNLHQVADPTAGSGYVESLTEELAAAAWRVFQDIESAGGAAAALKAGEFQKKVAKVRQARAEDVATRRQVLTGISDFASLADGDAEVLAPMPHDAPPAGSGATVAPLPPLRDAEPFERLRDAADAASPKLFLANLGAVADFNARATWTANLFAAGGIAAVAGSGGTDAQTIAAEFKQSGAALACLTSRDALYAEHGADVVQALVAAGATHVYVAGKAGEQAGALRQAGAGTFVHAGCNVLDVLNEAHGMLGIVGVGMADIGMAGEGASRR